MARRTANRAGFGPVPGKHADNPPIVERGRVWEEPRCPPPQPWRPRARARAAGELPGQDADAIVARVRETLGHVSDEAAHESLEALTAAGLLRRVGPDDAPAYEPG